MVAAQSDAAIASATGMRGGGTQWAAELGLESGRGGKRSLGGPSLTLRFGMVAGMNRHCARFRDGHARWREGMGRSGAALVTA